MKLSHVVVLTVLCATALPTIAQDMSREGMGNYDLSPKFKTMTLMRFPINWSQWRSQNEKTLHRRTNHQSNQAA